MEVFDMAGITGIVGAGQCPARGRAIGPPLRIQMENATVGMTMAFSLRLERREVEKRIYGVEASAAHGFR